MFKRTWSVVKEECQNGQVIDRFLAFESQKFVVIHIDSAEADHYGLKEQNRQNRHCPEFCVNGNCVGPPKCFP